MSSQADFAPPKTPESPEDRQRRLDAALDALAHADGLVARSRWPMSQAAREYRDRLRATIREIMIAAEQDPAANADRAVDA